MNKIKSPHCSIVIVTHNSQLYIHRCLDSLQRQSRVPDSIIIIDSGSKDPSYLNSYQNQPRIQLQLKENIGFCRGNNLGVSFIPFADYILFLNPDAFLTRDFIEQAIDYMESPSFAQVGALSGILLGYDIKTDHSTGKIDSTGIFQKWSGRWYDRSQGLFYSPMEFKQIEKVPALCGALMFCRKKALDEVLLGPNEVMDASFFMYKEDIDLSLRLKRKGWNLALVPQLIAYHCRGWEKDRTKVARHFKLMSARNEMRLYARAKSPYLLYSILKYWAVKVFNL